MHASLQSCLSSLTFRGGNDLNSSQEVVLKCVCGLQPRALGKIRGIYWGNIVLIYVYVFYFNR